MAQPHATFSPPASNASVGAPTNMRSALTPTAAQQARNELRRKLVQGRDDVPTVRQWLSQWPEISKMVCTTPAPDDPEDYHREWLPLHETVRYNATTDMIKLLLHVNPAAATVAVRDLSLDGTIVFEGHLPLHLAVEHQGGERGAAVVDLLLRVYPQAVMVREKDGYLPLHIAAEFQGGNRGTAIVDLLLKAYPDAVKAKEKFGSLPLHLAAEHQNDSAVLEVLLKAYPAAVLAKNDNKETPMDIWLDRPLIDDDRADQLIEYYGNDKPLLSLDFNLPSHLDTTFSFYAGTAIYQVRS